MPSPKLAIGPFLRGGCARVIANVPFRALTSPTETSAEPTHTGFGGSPPQASLAASCHNAGVGQSREEFDEVKEFVDQVFVDIDRPGEQLATIAIEINGDSSGGAEFSFNRALSLDQKRSQIQHAARMLLDTAAREQWQEGGFYDEFERRASESRSSEPES